MANQIFVPQYPFVYSREAKNMFSLTFLPDKDENFIFSNDDINESHYKINSLGKREFNTWDTWRLIPMNVPVVTNPQVVTAFTDLKNKDGKLDETSVLHPNTHVIYRQICSGKFDFYLDFSYLNIFNNFYNFYNNILENIHGKKLFLVLNENPIYMYFGRFFVEGINDNGNGNQVTLAIAYNIEPYIYLIEGLSAYYTNGKSAIEQYPYRLEF